MAGMCATSLQTSSLNREALLLRPTNYSTCEEGAEAEGCRSISFQASSTKLRKPQCAIILRRMRRFGLAAIAGNTKRRTPAVERQESRLR